MAVVQDDPYNRSPLDPTFRSLTIAGDTQNQGIDSTGSVSATQSGGGLPIMALVHFLGKLFGKGGNKPVTATAPTTPTAPVDYTPVPQTTGGSMSPAQQQLLMQSIAALAPLLLAGRGNAGANGNNPAGSALNGMVPGLGQNISELLASDMQRRRQQEPLYNSVLTGAMGMLPTWMRNPSNPNAPPAVPSLNPIDGRTRPADPYSTAVPRL